MSFIDTLKFKVRSSSPELKFIAGVVSLGFTLYSVHKAALKSDEILKKWKEAKKGPQEALEKVESGEVDAEYTEVDKKRDTNIINVRCVVSLMKNYALPAIGTGATLWFFHGAMMDYKGMFVGVSAAYTALRTKFDDEMKYIKDQLGEEKFKELDDGFKADLIKKDQTTGLKAPEKDDQRAKDNPYARWFDEMHGAWTDDPEANKKWLLLKQNYLQGKLQRRGYLFLNDIYEELGYPETDAGRVMGLIYKNPDGTTNCVDFGIFNIHDQAARWFVNGLEPVFLIDIKVDPKPITGRIGWPKY